MAKMMFKGGLRRIEIYQTELKKSEKRRRKTGRWMGAKTT